MFKRVPGLQLALAKGPPLSNEESGSQSQVQCCRVYGSPLASRSLLRTTMQAQPRNVVVNPTGSLNIYEHL